MEKNKHIQILEKYLANSIDNMSAYGKKHLLNENFYSLENEMNSGTFTKLNTKIKIKYYLSLFFQFIIFKNELISNEFIKIYKKICKRQKRLFNWDLIIHSIVMRILNEQKVLRDNVCVIGDGKANFVHGLLKNNNIKKIFSVNLPQSLIQDYLIIKKYNSIDTDSIKIVEKDKDISDTHKLFLIPAENKNTLLKKNINLFVNMFSFQEMPMSETHKYLDIARSNSAFLYSLNREEKIMYDETIINYSEYNLKKNGKVIFEKEAIFQNYNYNAVFPFIHKRKKKVLNTLVKYK